MDYESDALTQYKDELPSDMPKADYDEWYKTSKVIDGVRMGLLYPSYAQIQRQAEREPEPPYTDPFIHVDDQIEAERIKNENPIERCNLIGCPDRHKAIPPGQVEHLRG